VACAGDAASAEAFLGAVTEKKARKNVSAKRNRFIKPLVGKKSVLQIESFF
jgi:hypothetical protein